MKVEAQDATAKVVPGKHREALKKSPHSRIKNSDGTSQATPNKAHKPVKK